VQQAESSASRIRHQPSTWDYDGAQGQEVSVHAGGTTGQPANQGRTPVRERILDAREQAQDGDARNVINARQRGDAEARAVVGYLQEPTDATTTAEKTAHQPRNPRNPRVQPGDPHGELPQRFR
jgi:hypothetical protein